MSVLIRGLRMPDGCGDCPFCSKPMYNKYGYAYYQCDAPAAEANGRDTTGKVLAMYCNGEKESFPNFCPLVEVPPHGRLIEEADAIETAWMILRGLGYLKEENQQLEQTVRKVFATAPSIEVE